MEVSKLARVTPRRSAKKKAFDIAEVLRRIRKAVQGYPKAAMFELAAQGHTSLFEQLVACIISIRTLDEVSLPTAKRLFEVGRTPEAVARLSVQKIDRLIRASSFHLPKAAQIREIAQRAVNEHGGELPCEESTLLSFRGVGPKCANLALGIACGERRISVDIHVHRVTNRWGFVQAPTPEKTMAVLQTKLPRRYWIEINSLLVPFGKHVCTGVLPKCSTCPVLEYCRQIGVTKHR
jgi:endonuclease-3